LSVERSERRRFLRLVLLTGLIAAALAFIDMQARTEALTQIRFRYKWLLPLGLIAAVFIAQAWLWVKPSRISGFVEAAASRLKPSLLLKAAGALLIVGGLALMWPAKFTPLAKLDPMPGVTLLMVWGLVLLQSLGAMWFAGRRWETALLGVLVLDGLAFQVWAIFQPVTDYPFSLGWSEASRYYYGSLPFSASLYGESLPLSFLHGSRYLMQSIPYLIEGLPLWAHRLWQALLWMGMTGLTAWLSVRRLNLRPRAWAWILGAWVFLFYFQGVVYYHLQVCVILILAGVSGKHPVRSLAAVLAASFWAGMSRLNWFPVPAMLAIALYLLEEPVSRAADMMRYLRRPALWAVTGLAAALAGQAFYIAVSRSPDLSAFGSSFTSDLLWYRLLPNETYAFGVLPGILLVTLPAAVCLWGLRGRLAALGMLRLAGLGAMLLMLFAGGLVVSVKIGGGGDLHNMDAYLALLALIVLYVIADRAAAEGEAVKAGEGGRPEWAVLLLLVLIPVGLSFMRVSKPIRHDAALAATDLATLGRTAQEYGEAGPVLFMYERHLLTFRMTPQLPLVNEYEVVTLMEMAISGNQAYLEAFYRDLETHRFAAIIMRRPNLAVNAGDFVEENNAWNRLVAYPLACEYEAALSLESANLQVMTPRAQRECPDLSETGGQP